MLIEKLHPQWLTDADGQRNMVVLSRAEFEQILEALEDAEDLAIAEERLAAVADGRERVISASEVYADLPDDG